MTSERIGIVIGIVIGLLIAALVSYVCKTNGKFKSEFDERQELARGKAFKAAFYGNLIMSAVFIFLDIFEVVIPAERSVIIFFGLSVNILVYAVVSIFTDAYMGLNDNKGRYIITFIVIAIINLILSAVNGSFFGLITDGKLNYKSINLMCAIELIVIIVSLIIKDNIDKGGTAGEESED